MNKTIKHLKQEPDLQTRNLTVPQEGAAPENGSQGLRLDDSCVTKLM